MSRRIAGRAGSAPGSRTAEAWEFRLIYLASFGVFLLAALIARLSPARWRAPREAGRASILREARSAAYATIPLAFMS